jgi:Skp family chaperone for outer membrane proteins
VAALLTALVALPAGAQGATGPKFAVLDSRAVLNAAPGRVAAESIFVVERTDAERLTASWGDSLQAMVQAFQRDSTAPDSVKARKRTEIEQRRQSYADRAEELNQRLGERQRELVQPITDLVNRVIGDIRTEGNYTMIFDLADGASGLVAYDRNLDITERVVARVKTQPAPPIARRPTVAPTAGAQPARPNAAGPTAAPAGVTRPGTTRPPTP